MVKSANTKRAPVKAVKPTKPAKTVRATKATKTTKTVKSATATVAVSKKYTNMFAAYAAFWKRGFTDWRGTTSRSGYWWVALVSLLITLGFWVLYALLAGAVTLGNVGGAIVPMFMILTAVLVLYVLAVVVPSISLVVRRLHDAGFSAWWLLLFLAGVLLSNVPFIGALILSWAIDIVFLVFMLLPTKVDGNPYHKYNK